MAVLVYILCALTSLACALLLWRQYSKTKVPLTFWSALSFFAFTATNILLLLDRGKFVSSDLMLYRTMVTTLAVFLQLFGLIRSRT